MAVSPSRTSDSRTDAPLVRLFGQPRAFCRGKQASLPDRAYEILALLAIEGEGQGSREWLRQVIWPDAGAAQAAGNLRQTLLRLRRAQVEAGADFLAFDDSGVVRLAEGCRVDAIEWPAMQREHPPHLLDGRGLAEIFELASGAFMAGWRGASPAFAQWRSETARKLRESFKSYVGRALEGTGVSQADRLRFAPRLAAIDPSSDAACRVLMREHVLLGDFPAAAAALEQWRGAETGRDEAQERAMLALAADLGVARKSLPASLRAAVEPHRPDAAPAPLAGAPRVLIMPPTTFLSQEATLGLSQAFIEDVTVKLSRYHSFVVIAPHTARMVTRAAGAGENVPPAARAHYSVTSALKPTRGGQAMTFRLSEIASGVVLWAIECEFSPERLPEIFDALVARVVHGLVDVIERSRLAAPLAGDDALAYRFLLEGQRCLSASIDLPGLRRARKWFRDAARQAPNYCGPLVGLARVGILEWLVCGMPADGGLDEALALADRGLELDPLDWRGMREKGLANLYLRRHDACLDLFDEAVEIGPNDADLIIDHADALAFSGEPDAGLAMCERAMSLNPLHPGYYAWIHGSILFQQGRYAEALAALESVKTNPATSRLLAACAARAGDAALARRYARVLRETYPDFRADDLRQKSPNRRASDTEHLIAGLKLAGVQ